MGKLLKVPECL